MGEAGVGDAGPPAAAAAGAASAAFGVRCRGRTPPPNGPSASPSDSQRPQPQPRTHQRRQAPVPHVRAPAQIQGPQPREPPRERPGPRPAPRRERLDGGRVGDGAPSPAGQPGAAQRRRSEAGEDVAERALREPLPRGAGLGRGRGGEGSGAGRGRGRGGRGGRGGGGRKRSGREREVLDDDCLLRARGEELGVSPRAGRRGLGGGCAAPRRGRRRGLGRGTRRRGLGRGRRRRGRRRRWQRRQRLDKVVPANRGHASCDVYQRQRRREAMNDAANSCRVRAFFRHFLQNIDRTRPNGFFSAALIVESTGGDLLRESRRDESKESLF